MSDQWDDTQKGVAKSLFGRPLRVQLAAWIANREGSAFFLLEAQTAMAPLGGASSAVSVEVRRFVEVGMLSEFSDHSRVYFVPIASPLWDAFRAIDVAIGALPLARAHDHP